MLKVNSVHFSYDEEKTIHNINFSLEKGNNLAIIGESGCGKSTLLKLVYGLYDLDKGNISWNNIQVLGPKYNLIPGMEFMKYLAQDFDLMPFTTVAENVGHFISNINSDKKTNRVKELLEVVEMSEFLSVKVKKLSGGQMQRVAIAKVLAQEPEVLLLDEPFSHIDNFRKNQLRRKLFKYLKKQNITTLISSHDCTDILSFSDEIIVLKKGEIIQQGTPKFILNNPQNFYVASLFDDVNELIIDGEKKLIYPNQLKVTNKSNLKVEVINSYFIGNKYLIEGKNNNENLFFESNKDLILNSFVFLKISKKKLITKKK